MKQNLLKIISPLLFCLLGMVLKRMKPLFLGEDEALKDELLWQGFHSALFTHPSILFGERKQGGAKVFFLKLKVAYLKKCIKISLLKDEKGHKLMRELGMQPYYGNGVDFWFEESHSPIVPYTIPDNPKPEGRTVVYTALTGNYDDVHEVLYKEDDVDYLLFTNNPSLKSKTWQVKLLESELDNVLLSREIKMFPHKYLGDEYETSIYIDANAVIYGELSELTRYLGEGKPLAVSRHSIRKSVKEEFDACVKIIGMDRAMAEKQYESYWQKGFKDDQPLLECGILVRTHKDKKLQTLMQLWYNEFKSGVKRDQLSLLPCISRLKFDNYVVMNGSVWHNQFNRIQSHKK